jgi:hypothetical protein
MGIEPISPGGSFADPAAALYFGAAPGTDLRPSSRAVTGTSINFIVA